MNWGKVFYIFFTLMSLTTTISFIYEPIGISLFIAASTNIISTILKFGIRNLLAAELLSGSLVADLHLIPAFFIFQLYDKGYENISISLMLGAIVANIYTLIISIIESAKTREDF